MKKLVILLLILIVFLISLNYINEGISSQVVRTSSGFISPPPKPSYSFGTSSCKDYDNTIYPLNENDLSFYTQSYVETKELFRSSKTDYDGCLNENTVVEFYCRGRSRGSFSYNCLNSCENGACIEEQKETILLVVKDSLLPELQSDLDIWKQDIKNEYNYDVVQKEISTETPEEIKEFIKTKYDDGNLKGVLFVGGIPTVIFQDKSLTVEGSMEVYPSDKYYLDLSNECFSTLISKDECNSLTIEDILCYKPDDQQKCDDFISKTSFFWIARLTTPDYSGRNLNGGNNISLLSSYFKRNHDYRTGTKLYEHKMLAYLPILDSDSPSTAEQQRQTFLNQNSMVEKLNFYSGDINLVLNAEDYKTELGNPYEFVVYQGHGSATDAQGITSEELPIIKPKSLFYELSSCSNGNFIEGDYLAGNYLFQGEGLLVTALNKPSYATMQFPSSQSFLLDNGFNFIDVFQENDPVLHIYGDPTLTLTKRTNSDVEIKNIDLGQMEIPSNINNFYHKYFNVTIKNLGNEKVRLVIKDQEGTFEPNDNSVISFLHFNSSLNNPISLDAGEEKLFTSDILIHGSLQPVKFSVNYTFYSNAKNPQPKFSIYGELV